MGIFLDVVLVTSQAMGTILLVCSVGYYLARRKFLSPQIQAPVSWITINILVPTLMIASAGSFTSKQLLTWYYLLIIPIFQVIFSNILGRVGACVFTHFYSWSPVAQEIFILLSTFSNNQALPLVLVRTIGNSEELFGEYEDPKEVGTAMVMIYSGNASFRFPVLRISRTLSFFDITLDIIFFFYTYFLSFSSFNCLLIIVYKSSCKCLRFIHGFLLYLNPMDILPSYEFGHQVQS
eukprot:Rmarinus@m.17027